jgi:hypothetical protein
MPPLGDAFIVAAVVGGAIAIALICAPDSRLLPILAGLFLLGEIASWVLFVTVPVPGFSGTPEPVETIAVVSKLVEAFGVAVALTIIAAPHARRPRDTRYRSMPSPRVVREPG